jgi:adenylate cyclase
VQDEITREVAVAVQVEISAGEQARLWAGGTDNLAAWECVVRGNEYLHHNTREDNLEARRLADKALSHDQDYANAWGLLGFTHYVDALWHWGASREESLTTAEAAAKKTMELEKYNPDGLSLLACIKAEQFAFEEAVDIGRKAVSLSPKHSANVAVYAITLLRAGEYQSAVQEIKKAIRLSPHYPAWYMHVLGSSCFAIGEFEHAADAYQACVAATDPDSLFMPIVSVWLAICLASAGHNAEAKSASEDVFRRYPDFHIDLWRQFQWKDTTVREQAVKVWSEIVST